VKCVGLVPRESGEISVNTHCQGDKTGFEPPLDRL